MSSAHPIGLRYQLRDSWGVNACEHVLLAVLRDVRREHGAGRYPTVTVYAPDRPPTFVGDRLAALGATESELSAIRVSQHDPGPMLKNPEPEAT